MAGEGEDKIMVAVLEENEIVRHGLVALLEEDQRLRVTGASADALPQGAVDVAVVSSRAAGRAVFLCPIVVCADAAQSLDGAAAINTVAGVLVRRCLTGAQLRATVHAAAAGLRVHPNTTNGISQSEVQSALDSRSTRVLELLADGLSTREIALGMNYSERTIKKVIIEIEHRFAAHSRAQIVAQAIRRGLI